jgi:hypothetical protein
MFLIKKEEDKTTSITTMKIHQPTEDCYEKVIATTRFSNFHECCIRNTKTFY